MAGLVYPHLHNRGSIKGRGWGSGAGLHNATAADHRFFPNPEHNDLQDEQGREPGSQLRISGQEYQARRQVLLFPTDQRLRSEEPTSELQQLMSITYDVFCLKTKNMY